MLLKTKIEIENWLKKYDIYNYGLIEDKLYGYVVNVYSDVYLADKKLTKLEIKFNIINGFFDCSHNQLESLKGSPEIVNGSFDCSNNKLISLEGCPKIINGEFDCGNNQLKTLKGGPEIVKNSFFCYGNQLKTLIGSPKIIGGNFDCGDNKLISLIGCPEMVDGGFFCNNNKIDIDGLMLMKELKVNDDIVDLTNNKKLREIQNVKDFNELIKIINIYKEKTKMLVNIENCGNKLINLKKNINKI